MTTREPKASLRAFRYNSLYEILLGRWATSGQAQDVLLLYKAERNKTSFEKRLIYLKRIRKGLSCILIRLDHRLAGARQRLALAKAIGQITSVGQVYTLLDTFLELDSSGC